MLLTLLFWDSWAGPGYWRRRGTYVEAAPGAPAAPVQRRTVVEEEAPPADPPPY
jgi:hypothetical protein